MTWSVKIVKDDSPMISSEDPACKSCKHYNAIPPARLMPCLIPNAAWSIASLLTAIDTGRDEHMASGFAKLICNGYEKNEISSG